MRQLTQKFQMLWNEPLSRPESGQAGNGIEVIQIAHARAGLVMVSAHKNRPQLARARRDRVWIGAVAHDIAQIENLIVLRGRLQAGFQSFQIGMDIREDK